MATRRLDTRQARAATSHKHRRGRSASAARCARHDAYRAANARGERNRSADRAAVFGVITAASTSTFDRSAPSSASTVPRGRIALVACACSCRTRRRDGEVALDTVIMIRRARRLRRGWWRIPRRETADSSGYRRLRIGAKAHCTPFQWWAGRSRVWPRRRRRRMDDAACRDVPSGTEDFLAGHVENPFPAPTYP